MTTTTPVLAVPGKIDSTHLALPLRLKFDDWVSVIRGLSNCEQSIMFWLGDAMVYGEDRFNDQWSQILDESGYAQGTINNAMYVSRRVKPEDRRPELKYGHHYAVASLEPRQQRHWLARAVEGGLSIAELKKAVKDVSEDPPDDPDQTTQKSPPQTDSKLLQAVKHHECIRCGNPNAVAAHYQGIGADALGKGMGQKPHDIATAFLCTPCHQNFDLYEDPNGYERAYDFLMCIMQTIVVRMESDELLVK
jgi:hypothetical protein